MSHRIEFSLSVFSLLLFVVHHNTQTSLCYKMSAQQEAKAIIDGILKVNELFDDFLQREHKTMKGFMEVVKTAMKTNG
jgi:hypothetical protein